jgi:HAD superfamily hydrolase (TIGR01509 family)
MKKSSIPQKRVIQEHHTTKPALIFDLINVLFKENYSGFAQRIGYSTLASYTLTHWKNPGNRCLDMLHHMSTNSHQRPSVALMVNDRQMPQSIVDLHGGIKNCHQAQQELAAAITALDQEKFFSSTKEKHLMLALITLMLTPDALEYITEPIIPMINLVQKMKAAGYKLYLCANIPQEFYEILHKKYPDIIALFDGIVISSHVKAVKPDILLFQHLLTTYHLNPTQCIIIDNSQESINAAQTLGMKGILYTKIGQLHKDLKKHTISYE